MRVILTNDQIGSIITACEWAMNSDYPMSDPTNAHYQRIINKLKKVSNPKK